MAQSELTQEPQFKVYGADSVKFTVTNVDDEAKQITVSINCSEVKHNQMICLLMHGI